MSDFEAFNINGGIDVKVNTEVKNKRYDYLQWGQDNLYPQYLLNLKQNSPIHSVAADSTVSMAYGKGVEIEGLGNVLVNKTGTISQLYHKILYDFFLFNGYAVEVIWNRDRTAIASIYHIPFQNVRVGHLEPGEYEPSTFYVCENWENIRKEGAVVYGGVDPENREQRQLFYYRRYVPSTNTVYPVIPYEASIPSIVLEGEIFDYHKHAINTNLTPNLFIQMFGNPSQNERERIKAELVDAYTGKDGQKLMLGFSASAEEAVQVTPIASTVGDGYYVDILSYVSQSVLTSWQISSPLILGIHSFNGNGFSSNADELRVSTLHWLEYIIKPKLADLNESLEVILSFKYGQPVTIQNNFKEFKID